MSEERLEEIENKLLQATNEDDEDVVYASICAEAVLEDLQWTVGYAKEQAERAEYYEYQSDRKSRELEDIYYLLNEDYFENWEKAMDIADESSRDYVRYESLSSDLRIRTTKERLEHQNNRYRNLLESISTTNKVASEIFNKKDGKTLIGPDDILQHILRKVNKELEKTENA